MVSLKEVEHVALLARLGLAEEEKKLFKEQLSRILEYAEAIKALDTEKIEPTAHALPLKNVFRRDEVKPCPNPEEIASRAPQEEDGMFRVPKILE